MLGRITARMLPLGITSPDSPLWPLVRRYRRLLLPVAGLGLLASLIESVGIGALIPIIAVILGNSTSAALDLLPAGIAQFLAGATPQAAVIAIGLVAIALIAIKGLVRTINLRLIASIENRAGHDLRQMLADHLLTLDYGQYLIHDNVRLTNVIANDSWEATRLVNKTSASVAAAASGAVLSAILLAIDWRLCLVVLAGVMLIAVVIGQFERRLERLGRELATANVRLSERMLLIVSAIRPIRVFGQEAFESGRFARASQGVEQARYRIDRLTAPVLPLVETGIAALFFTLVLAASLLAVPVPMLVAFLVLLTRAQSYAETIFDARVGLAALRGSVSEVEWLLRLPGAEVCRSGDTPLASIDAEIRFDGVSYDYPDGSRGLSGASFTIPPGSVTALIGASGAGKSTAVSLLCGLIEPRAGEIRVGQIPLAAIRRADWSARIALAGQDVELVDGTIADNIAYGADAPTPGDLRAAAVAADADGFIRALPLGYETRINIENMGLSGGQKQRIGLARALLRRADLLILDEATSAVDGISEAAILQLLADRHWFRTALVIGHRRSTLAACDHGIVLADGEVRETGPLRDLAYYALMAPGAAG